METVILVVHLMLATALVGAVLMQRSEGGALGIGGGSGFMGGRGSSNTMTRVTAYLAAGFFATSVLLTLLAQNRSQGGSVFDRVPTPASPTAPLTPGPITPGVPATTQPLGSPSGSAPTATAPGATAPAPTGPAAPQPSGGILDRLKQQQPGGAPRLPQGQ